MSVDSRFTSGQRVTESGVYIFVDYCSPGAKPPPSQDERVVQLSAGGSFPTIRSTGESCFWVRKR